MKLFGYFTIFQAGLALECWTCTGKSYDKCLENGATQTCLENQEVCQVHQRKRDGHVYRVRIFLFFFLSDRQPFESAKNFE